MREKFNPSVTTCHLPYILPCKTQRRTLKVILYSFVKCPKKLNKLNLTGNISLHS